MSTRTTALELKTREKVRAMLAAKCKVREISVALGISTQAVYKHIKAIEKATEGAA